MVSLTTDMFLLGDFKSELTGTIAVYFKFIKLSKCIAILREGGKECYELVREVMQNLL